MFFFARFTPTPTSLEIVEGIERTWLYPWPITAELPRPRNVSPWSSSSCWAWCLGQMWVIMRRMLLLVGCAYRPQFLSHRHQHVLLGPLDVDLAGPNDLAGMVGNWDGGGHLDHPSSQNPVRIGGSRSAAFMLLEMLSYLMMEIWSESWWQSTWF